MAEQFQNFFVTKLREACDAVATTIYVETVPSITEGTLVLEYANSTKHEIIHFTGVSGYGLTGCTRGLEGTTAQSHSAGTDVRQNLTAGMIDKIINGVITTENIANSAVTTAKINNGAVTADKIDFTTLKQPLIFGTESSITLTTSQQTLITTSTIPAGKYVALVRVGLVGNGDTSAFDYLARVTDVSGNLIGELSAAKNKAVYYDDFLYFQSLVQLQSNMKLYLKVWRNTGSGLAKAGKNGVYNSTNIILIPIQ